MAEVDAELSLAADQAAATKLANDEQTKIAGDRVAQIVSRANAAIASGNRLDLEAVNFELGGIALTASEAGIVQGFVNSAIDQGQRSLNDQQAQQLSQSLQPDNRKAAIEDLEEAEKRRVTAEKGYMDVTPADLEKATERADLLATGKTTAKIEEITERVEASTLAMTFGAPQKGFAALVAEMGTLPKLATDGKTLSDGFFPGELADAQAQPINSIPELKAPSQEAGTGMIRSKP